MSSSETPGLVKPVLGLVGNRSVLEQVVLGLTEYWTALVSDRWGIGRIGSGTGQVLNRACP